MTKGRALIRGVTFRDTRTVSLFPLNYSTIAVYDFLRQDPLVTSWTLRRSGEIHKEVIRRCYFVEIFATAAVRECANIAD